MTWHFIVFLALTLNGDSNLLGEPTRRGDLPLSPVYESYLLSDTLVVEWGSELVRVRRGVVAIPVLPSTVVRIRKVGGGTLALLSGDFVDEGETVRWTAPKDPGFYGARILGASVPVRLNLMVMHPFDSRRDEALLGYAIGQYRPRPAGDPYAPPAGFLAVPAVDEDILISPHFTLGELLCKQPGEPRLLHFTPALVRKLEAILQELNGQGLHAPTLTVMSAFRTPAYNRSIGNRTDLSRHLWGDAADVFVDVDGDGVMDDLNGDGATTVADARFLARLVEDLMTDPPRGVRRGGLSVYGSNAAHGPFVHVDARGQPARW